MTLQQIFGAKIVFFLKFLKWRKNMKGRKRERVLKCQKRRLEKKTRQERGGGGLFQKCRSPARTPGDFSNGQQRARSHGRGSKKRVCRKTEEDGGGGGSGSGKVRRSTSNPCDSRDPTVEDLTVFLVLLSLSLNSYHSANM